MANAMKMPPRRLTVPEFLDWADHEEDNTRWQLRDGVPELMAPTTDTHGSILGELHRLIANHLLEQGLPCRSVTAPGVLPKTRSHLTMLAPDLGVTCTPDNGARGLPDPIVLAEILSASNEGQTRANIAEYLTTPTVLDILLVSSLRIHAERWFRMRPTDAWSTERLTDGNSVLHVESIGFSVPLKSVYRVSRFAA